jgi:hypothetical protein
MQHTPPSGFTPSTLILVASTITIAGCIPLPISHLSPVSAASVGAVVDEGGSPARGLRIAPAGDATPSACAWNEASATTDVNGRFALPALSVKRRIFWLTMVESFGMSHYWLCAQPASSSDTATRPLITDIRGNFRGDSIDCLEWNWQQRRQLTCTTQYGPRRITTGAEWSDGQTTGIYRLIVAALGTEKYSDDEAYLQWVELTPGGTPGSVRAVIELPVGKGGVYPYPAPEFNRPDGRWRVVIRSIQPTKWGNDRYVTYVLGKPGEVMRGPDL